MTSLNDIRSQFLQFFAKSGHEIVPSAPLVPRNDPTLLFTNAGMVPFKNVFTGAETRSIPRATSSQKCVRAGGKHNDLDNVGYTARHHTFFEMLGNFSFGDYFKSDAIKFAWDLVTKEFSLPVEKLLVTVYAEDEDAAAIWKKVAGLSDSKIIRISTNDNFWSMGDTGPCGPCSEIFFDHGDKIPGGPPGSADADGDRFIEIWNLVFMQFEQEAGGVRKPLPKPSIDTGMGLERIAAVLQGVHDNYDIDLFRALIRASADASGVDADGPQAVSHRVIADHLRASSFLIADGVLPSNEGRGYVLRRIMRRAMRHAHLLGAAEPLMWRLVPMLVREMGAAYPELVRAQPLVTETLKLEETRFRQTLERGLKLLDDATGDLKSGQTLSGDVAFKLYDTFGFPYDLTEDALRSRNIGVDKAAFDQAMAKQRADARASWAGSGDQATDSIWLDLAGKLEPSEFLGYDTDEAEGRIVAIVKDGKPVEQLRAGESAEIILNQTPFYGESGGQAGDTGALTLQGALFNVADTQKRATALIAHRGTLEKGALKLGDHVVAQVNSERRNRTRANHSATHLLHEALRRVLGEHVTQKGSSVGPERLRFDFSHQKPMTGEEIAAVERLVNAEIRANADVVTRVMSPDDAVGAGALALFGEKYGDIVRVLFMGDPKPGARPFSIEFCGGTHARRIGDIALFKIVSESAVSSGVRRIEALTGEAARLYFEEQERFARTAAAELKTAPAELAARVAALVEERRRLERELSEAKKALALGGGGAGNGASEIRDANGVKVIARVLGDIEAKDLRGLVDDAKKSLGSGVIAYIATAGGKVSLAIGVTGDLTARINAVDLVRKGAETVGGKGGGGRPDFAQAGGPDVAQADAALEAIVAAVASQKAAV